MKIHTYPALLGLVVAVSAQAADHRLAYSEANQLQVFVEHFEGSPWCSDKLNLRFSDPGAANEVILAQMMPRIGALLGRECANAQELNWRSVDAEGQVLKSGTSSAAKGWALVEAAKPTVAAPATPAPEAEAEEPAAVAAETAKPQPTEQPEAVPATESVETAAEVPEAAPQTAAQTASTPESAAVTETAPVPDATNTEEPGVMAAGVAEPADISFSVSGWQPRTSMQTLNATTFNAPLRDQNGCLFNTELSLDIAPEYMRVKSEGVSCDSEGLASGEGTLTITRSDGASLGTIRGHWYKGIAFSAGTPDFTLQHIRKGNALYGLLGSDPQRKIHYLIEAEHQYNGTWSLRSPRVIALTENQDLVRQAESLDQITDNIFAAVTKLTDRHTSSINILIASNPTAIFAGERAQDALLYQVSLNRGWSNKWSPGRAINHLFDREAREAREKAQAEARARREREMQMRGEANLQASYLERYQSLSQQPLEQRINNWIQEPGSTAYRHLMHGSELSYKQIVRINGKHSDGDWKVSEPYEAVLSFNKELDKGWYLVSGKISLDLSRQDKQKLPLSMIQADQVTACKSQDCEEHFSPTAMVAVISGQPDWSKEKARDFIERVENGQFD